MNKYLVYVQGPKDSLGFNFIENVVKLANKGATLQEGKLPRCSFPHSAWMYLETDEIMEDSPGFTFQIISEIFTKEQLEAMDWQDFKRIVNKAGVKGKDRQLMTNKYLQATDQWDSGEKEDENKE